MKRSILILVLIGVALPGSAEPEIKGTASELSAHLAAVPRTLFLSGEGEVKATADRAVVSLAVITEQRALQDASRANQELRGRMIKQLTSQGIAADRIAAAKFSSTPKYGLFGDKAKSYRVENVVKVTVLDEKEFQTVAQLVDAFPEVRYDSVGLEHSDKEGLKQRAATQAIEKVIEKQRLYEAKLGVKLTVKSFEEGRGLDGMASPPRRMMPGYEGKTGSLPLARGVSLTPGSEAGEADAPTAFGELVFKAQLVVEYAVTSR